MVELSKIISKIIIIWINIIVWVFILLAFNYSIYLCLILLPFGILLTNLTYQGYKDGVFD
jgi:hypothetical protein